MIIKVSLAALTLAVLPTTSLAFGGGSGREKQAQFCVKQITG